MRNGDDEILGEPITCELSKTRQIHEIELKKVKQVACSSGVTVQVFQLELSVNLFSHLAELDPV
jgi:hypothetical protein